MWFLSESGSPLVPTACFAATRASQWKITPSIYTDIQYVVSIVQQMLDDSWEQINLVAVP